MCFSKRNILLLLLLIHTLYIPAQNLTGTWEGDLGADEFLQLNIIQTGDKLCGYSYDYLKKDSKSFCKVYFEGKYNNKLREWELDGVSFYEKTALHFLMRLKLQHKYVAGDDVLEGIAKVKTELLNLLFGSTPDTVYLIKVSETPTQLMPDMKDCLTDSKKRDSVKPTIVILKPVEEDSIIPTRAINKIDSTHLLLEVQKRKNIEQSQFEVHTKTITLHVYDNAIIDDDTVSIFYNGKLLLSHQRLSSIPIVIPITVDEQLKRHEIILFAENLGSIPPNTALIVVTAGEKRYELFSSASLTENAVLVFEYKPK